MGTIRQGIFSDEGVKELLKIIVHTPIELEKARNAVAAIEQRQAVDFSVKDAEEELKEVESILNFEVRNETNDDGKPKYTNETLRASALRGRFRGNVDYSMAQEEIIKAKTRQAELAFDHAKAKNVMYRIADGFKIALATCGLIQGLCMEDNAEAKAVTLKKIADLIGDTRETK